MNLIEKKQIAVYSHLCNRTENWTIKNNKIRSALSNTTKMLIYLVTENRLPS